jgi:excisionase family DNA binding protein
MKHEAMPDGAGSDTGRVTELRPPLGVSGLVKAQEAADLLGVPKSWVLAQARKDAIPYVRLGHYVRFEPAVLEAWWQARRRGPVHRRDLAS